jgi:hypothetical protein
MAEQHDAVADATKKRHAYDKQARDKEQAEHREVLAGAKPTPTHDENDLAASGVHIIEHEPDGSPPDPGITPLAPEGTTRTRQVEAKKPATTRSDYQTRTATPHHD